MCSCFLLWWLSHHADLIHSIAAKEMLCVHVFMMVYMCNFTVRLVLVAVVTCCVGVELNNSCYFY